MAKTKPEDPIKSPGSPGSYLATGNVTPERLRVAERCLIAAAADQKELLCDENWQKAMLNIRELQNKFVL